MPENIINYRDFLLSEIRRATRRGQDSKIAHRSENSEQMDKILTKLKEKRDKLPDGPEKQKIKRLMRKYLNELVE